MDGFKLKAGLMKSKKGQNNCVVPGAQQTCSREWFLPLRAKITTCIYAWIEANIQAQRKWLGCGYEGKVRLHKSAWRLFIFQPKNWVIQHLHWPSDSWKQIWYHIFSSDPTKWCSTNWRKLTSCAYVCLMPDWRIVEWPSRRNEGSKHFLLLGVCSS